MWLDEALLTPQVSAGIAISPTVASGSWLRSAHSAMYEAVYEAKYEAKYEAMYEAKYEAKSRNESVGPNSKTRTSYQPQPERARLGIS